MNHTKKMSKSFFLGQSKLIVMIVLLSLLLLGFRGVAQVYHFSSNEVSHDGNGNATSLPTSVPRSLTKRLGYLRSKKKVQNNNPMYFFKESFQPLFTGNFESGACYSSDDHYFIVLNDDEISSFDYIFNYGTAPDATCLGEDFISNFNYTGFLSNDIENYAATCSKSITPESIRAAVLSNELWWGISINKPDLLEIKGKGKVNPR